MKLDLIVEINCKSIIKIFIDVLSIIKEFDLINCFFLNKVVIENGKLLNS